MIRLGNFGFIERIVYQSERITGSPAYWRMKKNELHTWIQHHVEHGNGPQLFFITLSCAEYYWPDIIRLLHERQSIIDKLSNKNETNQYENIVALSNNLSIVIQEYFHFSVETFLRFVGKHIFKLNITGFAMNLLQVVDRYMLIFLQYVLNQL